MKMSKHDYTWHNRKKMLFRNNTIDYKIPMEGKFTKWAFVLYFESICFGVRWPWIWTLMLQLTSCVILNQEHYTCLSYIGKNRIKYLVWRRVVNINNCLRGSRARSQLCFPSPCLYVLRWWIQRPFLNFLPIQISKGPWGLERVTSPKCFLNDRGWSCGSLHAVCWEGWKHECERKRLRVGLVCLTDRSWLEPLFWCIHLSGKVRGWFSDCAVMHELCREGRFSFIQSFIEWLHTRLKIEVSA